MRLSISQRLSLLIAISALGLGALGGVGIMQAGAINDRANDLATDILPSVRELGRINVGMTRMRANLSQFLVEDSPANHDDAVKTYESAYHDVQSSLANYKGSLVSNDQDRALIDKVASSIEASNGASRKVFSGERKTSIEAVTLFRASRAAVEDSAALNDRLGAESLAKAHNAYADAKRLIALSGGVCLGALLLAAFLIIRSILAPLAQLRSGAIQARDRLDFTANLGQPSSDELGQTVDAFQGLFSAISASLRSIQDAAGSVSNSSTGMRVSSDQVAQSSRDQGDASASMAAGVEELSTSIASVSAQSCESMDIARGSAAAAEDGKAQVAAMIQGIREMDALSSQAASRIKELGGQTSAISHVIQVIQNIAAQTNLLALNAAIEAARAGEAGRGFAIVADEVRKLAESTREATIQISASIGAMGTLAAEAVESSAAVELSAKRDAGRAQAVDAAISRLADSSLKAASLAERISNSVEDQRVASLELARRVEEIASAAGDNSRLAQDSRASAETLTGLAVSLKASSDRYTIA